MKKMMHVVNLLILLLAAGCNNKTTSPEPVEYNGPYRTKEIKTYLADNTFHYSVVYKYDSASRLSIIVGNNDSGEVNYSNIFIYEGSSDKPEGRVLFDRDGNSMNVYTYIYDADGNISTVEEMDVIYDTASRNEYTYSLGVLTRCDVYNSADTLLDYYLYESDSEGKITKITRYAGFDSSYMGEFRYIYENGLLVEEDNYDYGGSLDSVNKYIYQNGVCVKSYYYYPAPDTLYSYSDYISEEGDGEFSAEKIMHFTKIY